KDLPDYKAALVFGGGNGPGGTGKCFDTTFCFSGGSTVPVDKSNCSIDAPVSGADKLNIALVLPFGQGKGICGKDACLIPLEKDDAEGWKIGPKGRVILPGP